MSGIQYIVDEAGNATGVIIDLKKHRALWEDIYDSMIAKERQKEPRIPLATVKSRLIKAGKLRAASTIHGG